ncbi:MAG TPA: endonuclease/exonuclease/phosphatase family protein [Cyclobacteriaceae bacterium]|nr:endonuclease/exonuclease/phosphatase family protein [Cyclobacteriaceae bacterium]
MFKIAIRIFVATFALIVIFVIVFYIWAGSPGFSESGYNKIIHYREPASIRTDTFSVMTFNIGYLSGLDNNLPVNTPLEKTLDNLELAVQVVSSVSPTIIAFQEIDFHSSRSGFINQLDSIGLNSGYAYGSMAVNWDRNYIPYPYWPPQVQFGRMFSGQAILSAITITNNEMLVFPKPSEYPFYYNRFYIDRLLQITTLELSDRSKFLVLNVHFEAFSKTAREIDADILAGYLQTIPEGVPYLVMGDFNSRPPFKIVSGNEERTIRHIFEIGLESAIDESMYIGNPDVFNTFRSDDPSEMIDYIFYDPRIIAKIDAFVIRDAGIISDHLPVFMKFTLKN